MQVRRLHPEFLHRRQTEATCALQPRRQDQVLQGSASQTRNQEMAPEGYTGSTVWPVAHHDVEQPAVKSLLCHFNRSRCLASSQCSQPNCSSTFKKRRMFKLHLKEHEVAAKFKYVRANSRARSVPWARAALLAQG